MYIFDVTGYMDLQLRASHLYLPVITGSRHKVCWGTTQHGMTCTPLSAQTEGLHIRTEHGLHPSTQCTRLDVSTQLRTAITQTKDHHNMHPVQFILAIDLQCDPDTSGAPCEGLTLHSAPYLLSQLDSNIVVRAPLYRDECEHAHHCFTDSLRDLLLHISS